MTVDFMQSLAIILIAFGVAILTFAVLSITRRR